MLFGWWFSVRELLGVQFSWCCWSSYGIAISFSSFNPSPSSSIRIPNFHAMISCKYLHLSLSVNCQQSLSKDRQARLLSANTWKSVIVSQFGDCTWDGSQICWSLNDLYGVTNLPTKFLVSQLFKGILVT